MIRFLSRIKGLNTTFKALTAAGVIFLLAAVFSQVNVRKATANSSDIANAESKYPSMVGSRIDYLRPMRHQQHPEPESLRSCIQSQRQEYCSLRRYRINRS